MAAVTPTSPVANLRTKQDTPTISFGKVLALSCQHIGRAYRSPAAAISSRKAFASSVVMNRNNGFSRVGLGIG
jgi:hypothetical protein